MPTYQNRTIAGNIGKGYINDDNEVRQEQQRSRNAAKQKSQAM